MIGVTTLAATAPGTLASPVSNRIISYSVRSGRVPGRHGPAPVRGQPDRAGAAPPAAGLAAGAGRGVHDRGGLGGVFPAHFHFTSPLAAIVPNRLQANNLVLQAQLHPALSQMQSVLGTSGRPDAPFAYTNDWGNCLALLLPWLIARWWFGGTRRQRLIAVRAS